MAFSRERQRLPRAHPQVLPEPEAEQGEEGGQDRASWNERAHEEQDGHDGPRPHHAPPEAAARAPGGEQAGGTGGAVARRRGEGPGEEQEGPRQQEEAENAGEPLRHARIAGEEDGGEEKSSRARGSRAEEEVRQHEGTLPEVASLGLAEEKGAVARRGRHQQHHGDGEEEEGGRVSSQAFEEPKEGEEAVRQENG